MSNVSSSNSQEAKVPKLRFPEFGGEWNELPFEAIFDFLSNNTLSRAELSTEGKIMNIHYGDVLIKYESTLDAQNTNIPFVSTTSQGHWKNDFLCDGDVIIADTAEDETVGKVTEVYNIMDSKIVSGLHTIPCRAKVRFALCYLGFYMNSEAYHRQLYSLMQGIKVFSISKANISQTRIRFPSIPNQEKIVSLLMRIDKKIQLQKELIAAIKLYKRGALSRLFPKNGSRVPEYRFSVFTGDWEQRKCGDVLTERNVQHPQSEEYPLVSFTVENGVTPKTERYEREQLVRGDKKAKKYKETRLDDIVYNPANLKFGAIARNNFGNAVFSPIYVTYEVDKTLAFPAFVEMFVTRYSFIQNALQYQQGTVYERMAVNTDDFAALDIMLPTKEEQQKIGLFFARLDTLITLHQRKLDEYKSIKQGLLEKLFI